MEIAGDTAMWTRPDTGDCPVSYPAPTYSAVKAIFESIFWGPTTEVVPKKVELCTPVHYHSYTTIYGGPLRSSTSIKSGSSYQLLATVLINVCYKLYAEVRVNPHKDRLPESAQNWDAKTSSPGHAHQDIFFRRLKRGQCYSIPNLGWREFTPSYFGVLREETQVLSDMPEIIIPSMLCKVFSDGYRSRQTKYVYDQDVKIIAGCLNYPNSDAR